MKKNELIQSIKIIVLGLVLSLGISFVFAAGGPWTPAGGPSTSTNIEIPLNIGASSQTKTGVLTVVGSFTASNSTNVFTPSGFATNTLLSSGHAVLVNKIYVGGFPGITNLSCTTGTCSLKSAKANTDQDLFFKISKSLGLATEVLAQETPVAVGTYDWNNAATLNLEGGIRIASLAGVGERAVCMDAVGGLKICGAGTCGSANGVAVTSAPTSGLCATGTASAVDGSGPFSWTCTLNTVPVSCSAPLAATPAVAQCGSANNTTIAYSTLLQGNNRCASGSTFLGATWNWAYPVYKYTWYCGSTANPSSEVECSANLVLSCGSAQNSTDYIYSNGYPNPQSDSRMCSVGIPGNADLNGVNLTNTLTSTSYNVGGQYTQVRIFNWNCGALSCHTYSP